MERLIDTLRISVTDRCNLRCNYCMPALGIEPVSHQNVLAFEEMTRLSRIFVSLGIKRIRLTGGEPLVRKGIIGLIESIVDIPGIQEVMLTTNGIFLPAYAAEIKEAGIKRINVSLDTLRQDRFEQISGSDNILAVLEGIEKAKNLGFSPLKINTVIMRGINDDEILDFVDFALEKNIVLRFIEFMKVTPLWNEEHFMAIEEVKNMVGKSFGLEKAEYQGSGPAQYYKVNNGVVGFIKTDELNCRRCNRLRLTSTGELKLCLYEAGGFSLNELLRSSASDEEIRRLIAVRLGLKEAVDYRKWESGRVYMSALGG